MPGPNSQLTELPKPQQNLLGKLGLDLNKKVDEPQSIKESKAQTPITWLFEAYESFLYKPALFTPQGSDPSSVRKTFIECFISLIQAGVDVRAIGRFGQINPKDIGHCSSVFDDAPVLLSFDFATKEAKIDQESKMNAAENLPLLRDVILLSPYTDVNAEFYDAGGYDENVTPLSWSLGCSSMREGNNEMAEWLLKHPYTEVNTRCNNTLFFHSMMTWFDTSEVTWVSKLIDQGASINLGNPYPNALSIMFDFTEAGCQLKEKNESDEYEDANAWAGRFLELLNAPEAIDFKAVWDAYPSYTILHFLADMLSTNEESAKKVFECFKLELATQLLQILNQRYPLSKGNLDDQIAQQHVALPNGSEQKDSSVNHFHAEIKKELEKLLGIEQDKKTPDEEDQEEDPEIFKKMVSNLLDQVTNITAGFFKTKSNNLPIKYQFNELVEDTVSLRKIEAQLQLLKPEEKAEEEKTHTLLYQAFENKHLAVIQLILSQTTLHDATKILLQALNVENYQYDNDEDNDEERFAVIRLLLDHPAFNRAISDKMLGVACKKVLDEKHNQTHYVFVRELVKRSQSLVAAFETEIKDANLYINKDAWKQAASKFINMSIFCGEDKLSPLQRNCIIRKMYACKLGNEINKGWDSLKFDVFKDHLWKSDILDVCEYFYEQGARCLKLTPPNFVDAADYFVKAFMLLQQTEKLFSTPMIGIDLVRLATFARQTANAYAKQKPANHEKAAQYYKLTHDILVRNDKLYGEGHSDPDIINKMIRLAKKHKTNITAMNNTAESKANGQEAPLLKVTYANQSSTLFASEKKDDVSQSNASAQKNPMPSDQDSSKNLQGMNQPKKEDRDQDNPGNSKVSSFSL